MENKKMKHMLIEKLTDLGFADLIHENGYPEYKGVWPSTTLPQGKCYLIKKVAVDTAYVGQTYENIFSMLRNLMSERLSTGKIYDGFNNDMVICAIALNENEMFLITKGQIIILLDNHIEKEKSDVADYIKLWAYIKEKAKGEKK